MSIAGFLHDDGRFFDRQQAAMVGLNLTGFMLNEEKMISGEEWIPHLKDKDDAIDFGNRMHFKGLYIAKQRVDVFKSLRKHLEYVELLQTAIEICERKKTREIRFRLKKR